MSKEKLTVLAVRHRNQRRRFDVGLVNRLVWADKEHWDKEHRIKSAADLALSPDKFTTEILEVFKYLIRCPGVDDIKINSRSGFCLQVGADLAIHRGKLKTVLREAFEIGYPDSYPEVEASEY